VTLAWVILAWPCKLSTATLTATTGRSLRIGRSNSRGDSRVAWWRVDNLDPYAISSFEDPILVLEDGHVASLSEGVQTLFPSIPVLDWVGAALGDVEPPRVSACLSSLWDSFVRGESKPSQTLTLKSKVMVAQLWRLERKSGPMSAIVSLVDLSSVLHAKEFDVQRAVKRMVGENKGTRKLLRRLQLIGNSVSLRQASKRLRQVAGLDIPVLLHGETGTGKNVAASMIHALSPRRDQHLETINCAAIPEGLIESQLFGHKRGSFTGASRDQKGVFELAHAGTLFLDEVTELGLPAQAKLLRALETGTIRPVGAEADKRADVRLIAATNRDLWKEVRAGRFREDLYYRIRVFEVELPPLRERGQDIALLAHHFVSHIARDRGRAAADIDPAALTRLLEYGWPGNVRQLRNAIQFALVSAGDSILLSDLPPELHSPTPSAPKQALTRERIEDALRQCGGKRLKAAGLLGVSRVTLWKWIKRLNIEVDS
jgi:transcriptional regulator with PAS, ATPase and Fis domain